MKDQSLWSYFTSPISDVCGLLACLGQVNGSCRFPEKNPDERPPHLDLEPCDSFDLIDLID
jgi:hypothetical protein